MSFKLTQKQIQALVEAGGQAPSGGNIQPWLVTVSSNQLTISLNPKMLGTILDVSNYGSIFALGSFVENVITIAPSLGLKSKVQIKQENDSNQIYCQITFHKSTIINHPLQKSIFQRVTNRNLSDKTIIKSQTIQHLQKITSSTKQFHLSCISSNHQKKAISKVLGKADVVRTKHTQLLKEMMSEIRWDDAQAKNTRDGIDIKTMELPGNVSKMLKLLANHPKLGKTLPSIALEKQAYPMLTNSSHLCCLSVKSNLIPELMFQSGRVMQQIWLTSTKKKLAIHPWTVITFFIIRSKYFPNTAFSPSQDVNLLKLSTQLNQLFDIPPTNTPLFIFRLSHAKPPSTTSLRYYWQDYTNFS